MATTLSRMMKKVSASSVILLLNRITPPHRHYTSAIFSYTPLKTSTTTISTSNITNISRATSIPTQHRFSALAEKSSDIDETLLSLIEHELDYAEEKFRKDAEAPREFPFKIVHNAGERRITLTREYQGEEIEVTVDMPHDDNPYEEQVKDVQDYVQFYVNVSKKNVPTVRFYAKAEATHGFTIEYLVVKKPSNDYNKLFYEKPNFSDLDENLRKAFHKYLQIRGFDPSNTKFLRDYIILLREHMKCTMYLKDLKNFITD